MENKKMTIANFNIVFGEKEEPLLEYFDSVLMPAFEKDYVRKDGGNSYKFQNIAVIPIGNSNYALTGIIVKDTKLEVKSKYDENGILINADESYSSAPYSLFVIYLNNHRMVLVKNQKGSPDLKSFSTTIKYILKKYVREENRDTNNIEKRRLPIPIINIIGIPIKNNIKDTLTSVNKINKITLKFYPLNGDLDFSELFEGMATDLRKKVGSKTGSVILNSPTSIDGITDLLVSAQGTVEPTFNVTFPNGSKGTIKNGKISENMDILINKDSVNKEIEQVADSTKNIDSLSKVSEGNEKIFNEKKSNIIKFIKKDKE